MNTYTPKKYKIIDVFKETYNTKTFRVKANISYEPGQFFELSVFGIGECPISASSYSNNYIDFCVRDVGNTTHAINQLKKNDYLFIRGPYGCCYPLRKIEKKDISLIGGGTGIAPLRSVLDYIRHKRNDFKEVNVFFGFRDINNILFKREFNEWKKTFNLNMTLDKGSKKWKGNTGLVIKILEKKKISEDSTALICGPTMMVKSAIDVLKRKNISDNNIYISFERLMSCGIGKCGHCMIKNYYVCKDGPVFPYITAKKFID